MPSQTRLQVALYSGVVVARDAVSSSLKLKRDILRRLVDQGAELEIRVFTKGSDLREPDVCVLDSVTELLRQDGFWSSDIHMFEFAIHYDLFDAIFVVPPGRSVLVTDHNVTPPELLDDPLARAACEMALTQRHNMALATRVACDSEYNLSVDVSVGLPPDRLSVLHLPPTHQGTAQRGRFPERDDDGPVQLLYLGRFVRSKGVPDLVEAVEALWTSGPRDFVLTLAGNVDFSDARIVDDLRQAAARFGGDRLRLVADPTEDEVNALFGASDILVIPSYHEGYCVPVVEALHAGCYVVAYDAGNLPNVVGTFGTLVPTGDIGALTEAIGVAVSALRGRPDLGSDAMLQLLGGRDGTTWAAELDAHLQGFSSDAYELGFLELLSELATGTPAGLPPRTRALVEDRISELTAACAPSAS